MVVKNLVMTLLHYSQDNVTNLTYLPLMSKLPKYHYTSRISTYKILFKISRPSYYISPK